VTACGFYLCNLGSGKLWKAQQCPHHALWPTRIPSFSDTGNGAKQGAIRRENPPTKLLFSRIIGRYETFNPVSEPESGIKLVPNSTGVISACLMVFFAVALRV